jgi:hypothetical protein
VLVSKAQVVDVIDKGSGALILSDGTHPVSRCPTHCSSPVTTFDQSTGRKLSVQQFGTFQVGSGNFGGARSSPHERPAVPVPKRAPDAVVEEKTSVDQVCERLPKMNC